jgi:hypothetical protein
LIDKQIYRFSNAHVYAVIKKNGILSVFDPQQEETYCGLQSLDEWFQNQQLSHIEYLYYGSKHARFREDSGANADIRIRKRQVASPKHKKVKVIPLLFSVGKKPTPTKKKHHRKSRITKKQNVDSEMDLLTKNIGKLAIKSPKSNEMDWI